MITFSKGDLLQSGAEAVINTVNCVGVMGKGIALQFKQAFPRNYDAYRRACDAGEVRLGEMFVFDTGSMINPRWIINFPTKGHWKAKSRLSDIETGLEDLKRVILENGIRSIAVPPLGCGNGGLDWAEVEPVIRRALGDLDEVDVRLFAPGAAPKVDEMRVGTTRPNMSRGRALVLTLLGLYGAAGYRHSLLEVQKLTYFLQAAGEDLKLGFQKYQYGPYAENLNHVLQRIEGHFIRGYGDRSQAAEIAVLEGGRQEAEAYLAGDEAARDRLDRVAELIAGFETPYGLELLSTVHWVLIHDAEASGDPDRVVQAVHAWNPRKAAVMREPHIRTALDHLQRNGWANQAHAA
ncbi:O-acetyl-ADP-ribose deacetylase (regulator of RNase III) [Brevundimonas bullata]|jgi:O-acetyl-ADP-ribose deacetylase (regulator of RNase III)|uniref:O-acetyl-ADP-ribose deacetylase (Regulator of RNase III) n=1 Tax=Brevundimonas bullata TaxID=13160 RepID=A0A7W7N4U9_9CAUL|nr:MULTISPECIES: macro domain-containing protein [Brevundimonas]MBB4798766.1 O-acetyl-ADP-ribose deacetylase (regulator of RNase III) [Brevundimonas bullata]MBB6383726.1 O-acetyl-ADP-ribose deacetylase (regulator of RNase III) [Brevundimonas bullata]